MTKFTIGADPELFVKQDGVAVSAHDLIPGTKKAPHPVKDGAVQVDGTALEFNIDPTPLNTGTDKEAFNQRIISVMAQMKEMVSQKGKYSFNLSPVQDYSDEYLASLPPEAVELGCDPDYNAYTLLPNPRPDVKLPFRTGSGHIHIGWGADIPVDNPDHISICANFIKVMDLIVGFYMTIIDRDGARRRELYGKAGAFRPKSYGVEYRTPSNVWLSSVGRRRFIFEATKKAVWVASTPYDLPKIFRVCYGIHKTQEEAEQYIQDVINNGDYEAAYEGLRGIGRGLQYWDESSDANLQAELRSRRAYEAKKKIDEDGVKPVETGKKPKAAA
ncbi:hypothetical protein KGP36_03080 [Patescibacteria group bacterium]|nr:hypothetical protein [Patescibacteria group bacterium]